MRQCADWLAHLHADGYPPAVNMRPAAGWPGRAVVAVDLARVRAVLGCIAADVDELARARRVEDLTTAAVLPGRLGRHEQQQAPGPSGQSLDAPPESLLDAARERHRAGQPEPARQLRRRQSRGSSRIASGLPRVSATI